MSIDTFNSDGQPAANGLHRGRLIGRSADELIGICKGVLADGILDPREAEFLIDWMTANAGYIDRWPFDHLYTRLTTALADGRIDETEERELLAALAEIAAPTIGPAGESSANESLCDDPSPEIIFAQHSFCLTGKFLSGPRKDIEAMIAAHGGSVSSSVSSHTDYLVIGSYGSRDWLMSTHGTKIQKAAELKGKGSAIHVIAERNFVSQISMQHGTC